MAGTSVWSATSSRHRGPHPIRPPCKASCARCCPTTWSPRSMWCWTGFLCSPTGWSTGMRCRRCELMTSWHATASLAPHVTQMTGEPAEQGPVMGAVPLTPIQHWFFETQPQTPEHFDQSVTVELDEGVDEAALGAALAALAEHHDALRMRFELLDG